HVAMQGLKAGLRAKAKFLITPGSERIYQSIKRDGLIDTFEKIGGTVLANACGPCIGQWKRTDVGPNQKNTIVFFWFGPTTTARRRRSPSSPARTWSRRWLSRARSTSTR